MEHMQIERLSDRPLDDGCVTTVKFIRLQTMPSLLITKRFRSIILNLGFMERICGNRFLWTRSLNCNFNSNRSFVVLLIWRMQYKIVYMYVFKYVDLKRLSRHAGCQEVSKCCTRGESEESIACNWRSTQVRDPPWLWNPEHTSSDAQNSGISNPTKRTSVRPKKFKKKFFLIVDSTWTSELVLQSVQ